MDNLSAITKARRVRAELVAKQRFELSWRSSGESELLTLEQLCALLNLKPQSVRVYLANGRDSFSVTRNNPVTGEPDILTITRHCPLAKPKRPRGRPNKRTQYEADPRLGSEFQTGTTLAPPARTVPKQTNRRTREKPQSKLPK
jgi:hypothetical protein